jgi:DNA-directed RNA polymerase subunit RPC12/RpoP
MNPEYALMASSYELRKVRKNRNRAPETTHHEGYITWAEFERNQRLISDNARKSNIGRGSIRRGEVLLTGLLRCARCGRKLTVSYSGKGGPTQRYVCSRASDQMSASIGRLSRHECPCGRGLGEEATA